MDENALQDWIGKQFEADDVITNRLEKSFRATLEPYLAETAEGVSPLGLHWCLFTTDVPMAGLGEDGHPSRYPYLPPAPLPRRMWAGGKIELHDELHVGDAVHRLTTINDIKKKSGRTGELWFVELEHQYSTPRGLAISERQDIVYRAPAEIGKSGGGKPTAPAQADHAIERVWSVETSPALLFRYSAIIFVSHRIHYDLPYATNIEGYEGLVVHGPLQSTLLLNAAAHSRGQSPKAFSYRGISPAICGRPLEICVATGPGGNLYSSSDAGIHMTGHVEF